MYFDRALKTRRYFGHRSCDFHKPTKEGVMDHSETLCSAQDDSQLTSDPQMDCVV